MRVFVVGGTGFIGSWVVRNLAQEGHQVRAFHRGQTMAELPASVSEVQGDRRQLGRYASALREWAPDVVLDTCAYDEADVRELKRAIGEVQCSVTLLSSMDVYRAYGIYCRLEEGLPSIEPLNEAAPLRSHLFPYREHAQGRDDLMYRYDKIPVERFALGELERPITILRLGKVYGANDPQRHAQGYVDMISDGVVRLSRKRARWRWSCSYVENAAAAIVVAMMTKGSSPRVFNVADDPVLNEEMWMRMIGEASGKAVRVELREEDESDGRYEWEQHLVADTSRLRNELGWHEEVELIEALRRTFAARSINI